jgi:hypothetical protein
MPLKSSLKHLALLPFIGMQVGVYLTYRIVKFHLKFPDRVISSSLTTAGFYWYTSVTFRHV